MSLINKDFPYIWTYDEPSITYMHEPTHPTSGLSQLKQFEQTNDHWYCAVTTERCFYQFSIKELMGETTYQSVLNKSAYIVIDLSFEPFLNTIDTIYHQVVNKYSIPASQIIFMSNMYDADEYNKSAAIRHNSEPIHIVFWAALEWMLYTANQHLKVQAHRLDTKKYDKKFLNFNRRWRSHRPLLTVLLYYKKLIDKGYVSFGPCEQNRSWESIWGYLHTLADNNQELITAIDQSADIKNHPWWYLDTTEHDTNRPELELSTVDYYRNTYFSVISETTFYTNKPAENTRFITEKTFKTIVSCHPFILVSLPNSLQVLRTLGYKTFSPYIDESYDLELDDSKRMLMIVNEIERLSNLNQAELDFFIKRVYRICLYNYNHLKKKSKFISTNSKSLNI